MLHGMILGYPSPTSVCYDYNDFGVEMSEVKVTVS